MQTLSHVSANLKAIANPIPFAPPIIKAFPLSITFKIDQSKFRIIT